MHPAQAGGLHQRGVVSIEREMVRLLKQAALRGFRLLNKGCEPASQRFSWHRARFSLVIQFIRLVAARPSGAQTPHDTPL